MASRHALQELDPVELLARRTGHSIGQAQRTYDVERAKLQAAGNDQGYLEVLALRRTREALLARQKAREADDAPATADLFAA